MKPSSSRRGILACALAARLAELAAAGPTDQAASLAPQAGGLVAASGSGIANDPCFLAGLRFGQASAAYRAASLTVWSGSSADPLYREWTSAAAQILAAPAHSLGGVLAKLIMALDQIGIAREDAEALEPCEVAEHALLECIRALSEITGISLDAMGADFVSAKLRAPAAEARA
ncbi:MULTISPECIES: hypothetical protein [Roseomonadaceae]|uniref:Uncharacterized protein n=1 Tax=Falsiroseomonas oleicola TaxID=2801474 RepID=A0ABS6H932_9PROT|nr:hypothetical protein [Roseomonas oleicola]MBU8544317.1 hypothetical protein [Roseomonas oleicola]